MRKFAMNRLNFDYFATALMIYLTKRSSITWRPSLIGQHLMSREDKETLLIYAETVGRAVKKISSAEFETNVGQFEHLELYLRSSMQDFPNLFIGSTLDVFLQSYTTFKFIYFMAYITSFAIYCVTRGYPSAPDLAAMTITGTIRKKWDIFSLWQIWPEILRVAKIINQPDYEHSFFCDCGRHS